MRVLAKTSRAGSLVFYHTIHGSWTAILQKYCTVLYSGTFTSELRSRTLSTMHHIIWGTFQNTVVWARAYCSQVSRWENLYLFNLCWTKQLGIYSFIFQPSSYTWLPIHLPIANLLAFSVRQVRLIHYKSKHNCCIRQMFWILLCAML